MYCQSTVWSFSNSFCVKKVIFRNLLKTILYVMIFFILKAVKQHSHKNTVANVCGNKVAMLPLDDEHKLSCSECSFSIDPHETNTWQLRVASLEDHYKTKHPEERKNYTFGCLFCGFHFEPDQDDHESYVVGLNLLIKHILTRHLNEKGDIIGVVDWTSVEDPRTLSVRKILFKICKLLIRSTAQIF